MAPNIPINTTTLAVFSCLFIISSVIFVDAAGTYGYRGIHLGSTEKATHRQLDFQQRNCSSNSSVVCVAHANATGLSSSPASFDAVVIDDNALMEGPAELPISRASLLINFSATSNETAAAAKAGHLSSLLHHVSSHGCLESERTALLRFKAGLHDADGRLSSWRGLNCCGWAGVTCDYAVGSVVKVDLSGGIWISMFNLWASNNQFMPGNLSGMIEPSLLQLSSLRYLDLSGNSFNHISIPDFIGSFKELRYLNLSYSGFAGAIPHQLGNLSNLQYLDLSEEPGLLRVDNLRWVSGLSSLRHLALDGVDLSTVGPGWIHLLNERLPFLAELHLRGCSLGSIPTTLDYVNFTSLEVLDLSSNSLISPTVPGWLPNISSLVHIDVSDSGFNGAVPLGFSDLPRLKYLDLTDNYNLTANISELLGHAGWQTINTFRMSETNLHGEIPASIGNITSLTSLHLGDNNMQGGIPSSIGKLCRLNELNLRGNNLTGELPPAVRQLSELTVLDVSGNRLTGIVTEAHFSSLSKLKGLFLGGNSLVLNVSCDWIPPFQLNDLNMGSCQVGPAFPSWINSQRELLSLDLSGSNLTGGIPAFIGKLNNLRRLDLSGNNLTGGIPAFIGKLKNLRILSLSTNNLTGGIPAFIGKLKNLRILSLSTNNLTGGIPAFIGKLNNLEELILSGHNLTGGIPASIGQMSSLQRLHLSNNGLSGCIPASIGQLGQLWSLHLLGKNLTGHIPTSIGEMDQLFSLSLSKNNLTGSIPKSIGRLHYLQFLDFSGNKLTGGIPKSIGRLHHLPFLDFSGNKLSGDIPTTLLNCSFLEYLNLGNNHLSGVIPTSSRFRLMKDLKVLNLSDNLLSGEFPSFTCNLSGLMTLDLASNNLSGVIPTWIENIQNLTILRLRSNRFSGQIPSQVSKLKLLQVLDLAKNDLAGPIPEQLGGLSGMMHAAQQHSYFERSNQWYYAQTLVVHMKGLEQEFIIKIIFLLTSIDLSDNHLSGKFPESLINLSGLVVLDLSRNILSGTIPERIGNMHELESLDLSNNSFTGRIPPSMTSLSFLGFLNLSNNHLSGEIPRGGQLDTFNDSSFLGNPDLCGPFLQRSCPRENQQHVDIDEDEEAIFEQDWFYLGLGLGFAFGLLAPFLILIIKRSWSEVYFRVVDQIVNRISQM